MRLFFLIFLACLSNDLIASNNQVAIIIDDIGYREQDKQALTLPGRFTYSILPHTPYGSLLARSANQQRRDVMLHLPMEALNGKAMGEGGIMVSMSDEEIVRSITDSLESIPFVIGVNNHMGSRLTQEEAPLRSTMRVLSDKGLFFLDSRTTNQSVAEAIAGDMGLTTLHRNIFLDHIPETAFIEKQFRRLIALAKQNKRSIAIAHPYPQTLAFLQNAEARLKAEGITLVPISTFLPQQQHSSAIIAD